MKTKTVKDVSTPPIVKDGVNLPICRIIQGPNSTEMDPFLLFDYFSAKSPLGFYDHPHRGFEMLTYMIKGKLIHEDFRGNKAVLGPGDFSWSSIGRGVVHSEMPASTIEESVGFILWSNLPKEEKFGPYSYKSFESKSIPVIKREGINVKVLVGEAFNLKGLIQPKTEISVLDVHMQDDCIFEHMVPKGWNALCFVYEGEMDIIPFCTCCKKTSVEKDQAARLVTSKEDRVLHIETGKKSAKFLLIAGKPLNEPVHQHGPFVLATQKDLRDTLEDFKNGVNGFEGAKEFVSEFGKKPAKNNSHT